LVVGAARLHARTNARWDRVVRRRPLIGEKRNPINCRELTENEAIDLAANIIGEGFLLYLIPSSIPFRVEVNDRAVATTGLWFQQSKSNRSEKEEKQALMEKLKQMQEQLEFAGKQLVRQHEETRKELESVISDLKLETRHIRGDWNDFKEQDLFTSEQVWEIIAKDDAKRGGTDSDNRRI
jgi:hypothetical protein